MLSPYVSVDCVLLGINDDKLTVLLAERKSEEGELIGYKLPGSLIYENEDLDDAAYRILNDSTGLKRVQLKQFRCFGSPARTSNRLDVMWLEATSKAVSYTHLFFIRLLFRTKIMIILICESTPFTK